jgi:hypothetical protein
VDSVLATLRGNKLALYGAAGFTGGAVGAVVAEPFAGPDFPESLTSAIVNSGIYGAVLASILAAALFAAAEWHQRREITPPKILRVMLFGAVAGFISGAAGTVLYNLADPGYFQHYVVRIASWALSGLLLGAILSRRVPNLGLARGAIAGAVGGAVGCVGALITWSILPESAEFVGRIIGFGLLGLALGLAIHIVENMVREACVEVEWAPNETSRVSLGATPVTVGGGEDHIFIRGLPHHVSSIVFTNGQIEHIETANGKRTPLQDGSRLRIGGKYMVVHASK